MAGALIAKGSHGFLMGVLQYRLRGAEFNPKGVDGYFGPNTVPHDRVRAHGVAVWVACMVHPELQG